MTTHGPERPGATPAGDAPRRTSEDLPMDAAMDTAMDTPSGDDLHHAVGAYALGVLDDDEMTAFEAHLADCEQCAEHLDELVGMGPLLANLSDLPAAPDTARAAGTRDLAAELTARPSRRLAEELLAEVTRNRTRRRRRARYLVAAAAALIIGGPLGTLALHTGDAPTAQPGGYQVSLQRMTEKTRATDPITKVRALIGMTKRPWGTDTILELKNVKGPLKCSLIVVGKDGHRETMGSWTVPATGYGLPDSPDKNARLPLYIWAATSIHRSHIDHFEVVTSEGKNLVKVDAQHST